MKNLFLFVVFIALVSCKNESATKDETAIEEEPAYTAPIVNEGEMVTVKTPEQLGQEIYNGKGKCVTCHQIDKKLVGPSLQDIAKKYKEKNGSIVTFLKGEADPIVDPSQFEVMKANFVETKKMSDKELEALEAYYLSQHK